MSLFACENDISEDSMTLVMLRWRLIFVRETFIYFWTTVKTGCGCLDRQNACNRN